MNYTFTYTNSEVRSKPASEMAIGDIGTIVDSPVYSEYEGEIILRSYSCFVSLTNPRLAWIHDQPTFLVRPLGADEEITIRGKQ